MKASTFCPAKINLSLKVYEPDPNGYHRLESVFQAISLGDDLEIEIGREGFAVLGADLPRENTLTKTLRLLREVMELPPIAIHLTKRIPVEAGLGGGSSDAAGLLRLLRQIYRSNLTEDQIFDIAAAVGADVPFFLIGGKAEGWHYGEICSPLPDDSCCQWLTLAKPQMGCNTAQAYRKLDELRGSPRPEGKVRETFLSGYAKNDFLLVAPTPCIELAEQLRNDQLEPVGLCGSGSCVFGFARSKEQANEVCERLDGVAMRGVYRTLTRSESLELRLNMG